MTTISIAKLGMLFLALGFAATFLMYWLWGYPFDKETRTSEAPKWAMWLHRFLGYSFLVTYVAIMWHMVPRLWEYQVEFPARTVAHILLGFTVGFLLLIKVCIRRFFRHFEEWMPVLGTTILLCTVLLLALSVPIVFKEHMLSQASPGGSAFSQQNIERVSKLMERVELPAGVDRASLASKENLQLGRNVLVSNCVKCHDLRTILTKPRTPRNWHKTVVRMGEKPALFEPITAQEQLAVTTYLVAITPSIKRSMAEKKEREAVLPQQRGTSGEDASLSQVDPKKAQKIYEEECGQCHELSDVDEDPPTTDEEVIDLIKRMVEENDAEFEPETVPYIRWYLNEHYVRGKK